MRALGTLPSLRISRDPLVLLGLLVVFSYAAYESAELILADDTSIFIFGAVVFVGIAVAVAILNDWRRGVYTFVAWILFEDLARKYLGNNMLVYFGKDILALILYLSFFRARHSHRIATFQIPFRVPLLLFIWFCALQMLNPASNSIFFGILGAKVDFIYIPLIYVGYAFIGSEESLRRFFGFVCVLILAVVGLGLAQSIIGPTLLNPADIQDDIRALSTTYRVAPISGLVAYRPTSVFVSAGRFQDFLVVAWTLALGFGGYLLLRSKRWRILAFTTIGAVAAASLMSASRGVFMWNVGMALIFVAAFLWGAPWRQREALRVVRAIQRTLLVVGLGILVLTTIFPDELGSRLAIYSETLLPGSPASELVHRTQTYPLMQLRYAFDYPRWPYGYGLGTCTLGTQYVVRIMHARPMGIGVESGFGNLILELGIFGLVLWLLLSISIVISAGRVVYSLRGSPWFPLGFLILLYAFLLLFPMMYTGNNAYQDFIFNSYLWLTLGILYRLPSFRTQIVQSQPSLERA